MKKSDKKMQMAVLDAIIKRQHEQGHSLQLKSLCSILHPEYSKVDIVATVQYLVNIEIIDARDGAARPQKNIPPKYCEGGDFLLRLPPKGILFYEEETKNWWGKVMSHLLAPKVVADYIKVAIGAGAAFLFPILWKWIN